MEEKYHTLSRAVDRIAVPFCVLDSDATSIKYANTKYGELFGFDVSQHSEMPSVEEYFASILKLGLAPAHLSFADFLSTLRDNFKTKTELRVIRKISDGRYFRLEIYPEDEHDIVVTYTDVTDLEVAIEEARKAEIAKSEFMANMSHEIRTPMNGVLGMAQILAGTELSSQQEKCVDVIQRSGKALITIINDILDFSKMEAGQLKLVCEPFNLQDAIDDVMSLLGHSAREKGVEIIAQMPASLPQCYIGDMGRIRQILINLIGNAIKFTEQGYVKLSVSGEQDGEVMRLSFDVQDTGIGIAADKISRIFVQFEQADNSTTRLFGGTGLGLTITRRLVEVMDGEIRVTSELGTGSVFSFSVPLPLSEQVKKRDTSLAVLKNVPILIVDDLKFNREIISEQVEQMGGRPFSVGSAPAALELMRKAAAKGFIFPAVISDYQMPNMDGLSFIRAVRADPLIAPTPIMVLSSVDLAPLRASLAAADVEHAITKPATIKDLHGIISQMIKAEAARRKEEKTHAAITRPVAKAPQANASISILAADDDEVNRLVVQGMLKADGYDLTIVENGKEAVDAFKTKSFDVILMDIAMPVMDGVTAVRNIRKIEALSAAVRTPIIATTAHAMENDRDRFLEAGLDDYLPKPLSKQALLERVEMWANKPDATSELPTLLTKAS